MADYLFHVTIASRLPSIGASGLRPGRARFIGSLALDDHARKGIFLTEAEGVPFWFDRAELWANDGSDDLLADQFVPVVLRVLDDEDILGELVEDEVGTDDAMATAWISTNTIIPENLEVFDGAAWVPLSSVLDEDDDTVSLSESFPLLKALVSVDTDEDGEDVYDLADPAPLLPSEALLNEPYEPR